MPLKATAASSVVGERPSHPAWWLARGARSKDGPVTWENLVLPREGPAMTGADDEISYARCVPRTQASRG